MKKLIFTSNIPFDLSDWADAHLVKVVAGAGCVMALTSEGDALQKIQTMGRRLETDYWYDLKDIALSKICEGIAIGLRRDGTCQISERALRNFLGQHPSDKMRYREIYKKVDSWKNIVQVACSDAFFGLDDQGRVHYAQFSGPDYDYRELSQWEDVVRIVTGPTSNAVFGITSGGSVLAAGANLTRGPMGDVRDKLAALTDVVDLSASGTECGNIVYVCRDGALRDLYGTEPEEGYGRTAPVLEGHYVTNLARREDGGLMMHYHYYDIPLLETEHWRGVVDYSIGDTGFETIFAVALTE